MNRSAFVLISIFCLNAFPADAQNLHEYSGEAIFERFCASCHGTEGKGDGPVARAIPTLVPDLTRLSERRAGKFPEGDVRQIIDGRAVVIHHGTRYMPVWGYEFWVEEGADVEAEKRVTAIIEKLIGYLRAIQR